MIKLLTKLMMPGAKQLLAKRLIFTSSTIMIWSLLSLLLPALMLCVKCCMLSALISCITSARLLPVVSWTCFLNASPYKMFLWSIPTEYLAFLFVKIMQQSA